MLPRITIITPCLNGERYIAEMLKSLRRQAYPNLEHLVLDGGSTDGTLKLLADYPGVTLTSEPDRGAHDAINKGLARASGEIIGFIAVDDIFPDGALDTAGRLFAARPAVDVVVGQSLVFEDDGAGHRHWLFARTHPRSDGLWLPELTFGVPGIFGCFFRRRVFERVGAFDESYRYASDRQFLIRIALKKLSSARVDRPTIYYRMHSGSQTINREKTNLRAISIEYFRMSATLATKCDDRQARRILLAWHAFEGAKLILRGMMRWRTRDAFRIFVRLCICNPMWPLRLMNGLMLRHAVQLLDKNEVLPTGTPP